MRHRHERTGVAGTDAGIGLPRLDEVEGAAHGGVFLAPQGLAWMIVHLHHLLGEQAFDVRPLGGRDPMLELGPPADQREPDARKFCGSREGGRHANRRPAVAAHGVDGNVKGRGHGLRVF